MSASLFPALVGTYVMLDLETTGATSINDRITEIALVRVEDGVEVARYSSLVDPEQTIPPFIERLTGISNAMVEGARRFKEIADEVYELLNGAVLVAHNVRFDHGFLKNEFARVGQDLKVKTLCTVRLSRKLYPEFKSHGLDAIMQRHQLQTQSRHRAMGDVEMVLAWLKIAEQELGLEQLQNEANELLNGINSTPLNLETPIKSIPKTCGVYFFYGEGELPLYIGKSVNIRSRVLSHFAADHKVNKEMRMAQEVKRVTWQETAGELGALLLEARLVKTMQPVYNQQLRRQNQLCTWQISEDINAKPALQLCTVEALEANQLEYMYGPFRSKRQAHDFLRELALKHQLCPQILGLESGKGRCFANQVMQCRGACCGKENLTVHYLRLQTALNQIRLARWPYKGKIGIQEYNETLNRTDIHLFDQWCHLATVKDQEELDDVLQQEGLKGLAFDLDTYKLLRKHLAKPSHLVAPILQF